MKIPQSILTHLKKKGFDLKNKSNNDIIEVYKSLYFLDITKEYVIKNSSNYISINVDYNTYYVYVLISFSTIVYVGITNNIPFRIGEHIKSNKIFDSVFVHPISNDAPKEIEYKFICKFLPKYNSEVITKNSVVKFIHMNLY
jgi:hypothetical protein